MNFTLKKLLEDRKRTQKEMADNLKLSTSLVNQYVQEKCYPNYDTLCQIADFLHVSTDELLGRQTNNVNLEALEPEVKTLIQKILKMNNTQKAQTITFVNALTMFDE